MEGEDQDYPLRWHEIKRIFSLRYLQQVGGPETERHSHSKRKDAFLWQRRYWEHTIRDEQDMKAHLDYVHYNPVKHGLVDRVCDWPWSSFHRYVELGWYEKEWGDNQPLSDVDFGE